ncbi:XdhC family protein [Microbacterium sp. EST19A]|uniref:XdhC family protein n=1 Tax=Microbacterium sp. EST19A TaxID=2862681 RepID=UPI001CBAD640|nr:XdhC/CoxI family protein [Microbacterium sp. EST19A]
MLDRIQDYRECLGDPDRWAIATIIEVSGSVPRPAGTSMAVRGDGRTIGSVSGGCVEGAVVDAALTALECGVTAVHSFGYADDDGLEIGLMCGGDVRVLVQPLRTFADDTLAQLADEGGGDGRLRLVRDVPLDDDSGLPPDAVVTAFAVGATTADISAAVGAASARLDAALLSGGTRVIEITDGTGPECRVVRRLLVESSVRPARVLIYGANDFSAALAQAAAALGRHVTVCDARPVFATHARHPGAHEVVRMHPVVHFEAELAEGRIDARTAVILLTHDPRFDLPVLDRALRLDLSYVGAMGSRVTHEKRAQELRAGGLGDGELGRLHSPIGLDLGARTPEEVAVSILAELILTESRSRGPAVPDRRTRAVPSRLRDTAGDVHDDSRVCMPEPSLLADREVPAWT